MRKPSGAGLSEFRIFETDEFCERLRQLPKRDAAFVAGKLAEYVYPPLKAEPFFGTNVRKLRGYTPDTWRYRIGRFRVFYTVNQDQGIIYVVSIDQRKDAYR